MNFSTFLQVHAASPQCMSIFYPSSPRSSAGFARPTIPQLRNCSQFESLALAPTASSRQSFQRIFGRPMQIPWQLDRAHLGEFRTALQAFRTANPHASDRETLQFIFDFPFQNEGPEAWNIQLERVQSWERSSERTAVETIQDHRTRCTGIAYLYTALLTAAGYTPHFAWRSYNQRRQVIEHMYVEVTLPNNEQYSFDPLFYSSTLHRSLANEEVTTLLPREALAWYYNNEALDFVTQWNVEGARAFLGIALNLDPHNPYIRANLQNLAPHRP